MSHLPQVLQMVVVVLDSHFATDSYPVDYHGLASVLVVVHLFGLLNYSAHTFLR